MSSAEPAQPRWRLRRRLGLFFGALAAVLAIFVAIASIASIAFVRAGNDVIYRWQPATATSQRLLADLVNQETGVRGYALSGKPASLEPYAQYRAQEARDIASLTRLTRGDVELVDRQRRVEQTADVWVRTIAQPLIAQLRAGRHPGTELLDVEGKARFDEIRTRAAILTAALVTRSQASRDARTSDGVYAGIFHGLTVLVMIGAGVLLWRGLHRWVLTPVDALAGQIREVASGQTHREIVPDGPAELTDLGQDVEEMRRQIAAQLDQAEVAQVELRRRSAELARSNDDLQQFAYVASHDLSEPLRKVANFCQLLERQYADQLDDRAKQYIDFAVDGAKRMQALITDLLALSRVGRTTERFEPIDLDKKLDIALDNLADRIATARAQVERLTPLPTVNGDRLLLTSLLENLVGNAVKYRRDDVAPVVRISAELDQPKRMWVFTVSDNGIGIQREYAERIFAVFQRLHLRDQYGGTGIGLALCRRIVEFHGGQIWLADVQSEAGATFRFTIPDGGRLARSPN
jgi:signal transduction histidine kinase